MYPTPRQERPANPAAKGLLLTRPLSTSWGATPRRARACPDALSLSAACVCATQALWRFVLTVVMAGGGALVIVCLCKFSLLQWRIVWYFLEFPTDEVVAAQDGAPIPAPPAP